MLRTDAGTFIGQHVALCAVAPVLSTCDVSQQVRRQVQKSPALEQAGSVPWAGGGRYWMRPKPVSPA